MDFNLGLYFQISKTVLFLQNDLFIYILSQDSKCEMQRVVDKNDEKLRKLKNQYGEEVYNEVIRAKLEIEDHNASGSYVIVELWNYEENRKATMEEATDVMLKIRSILAAMKNKRKRH